MIQKAQLFQLPQIMQVYAKARIFMAQNGNPLQWGQNYPPEDMIRQVLLEVGAPDHLAGHPYVVQGVLLVLENWEYMNNVMSGLYPRLAELFDSTPSRIERSIRHVIEVAWSRGDLDVLERYFGNTVSASKGKPTNSEFMARVANIVRQRMKRAAADEACGIRAGVDIQ